MDKFESGADWESLLEVSVELMDSEPGIWRLLEVRGSLTLDQMHRVLQAAFGWEGAYPHRFATSDPFQLVWPVSCKFPEFPQWLPGQGCEQSGDRPEEHCSLERLLALGSGRAFYEFDFGGRWLHRIELVTRRPVNEASPPAKLVDGARHGPLDEFGGDEANLERVGYLPHPENAEHSARTAEITDPETPLDRALLDIAAVSRALAEL